MPQTPVFTYQSSWGSGSGSRTSSTFSQSVGDLIVVLAAAESSSLSISDSRGLSWVQRVYIDRSQLCETRIWTASVNSAGSGTVSVTISSSDTWGYMLAQYANGGVGAYAGSYYTTQGSPTMILPTTTNNSGIAAIATDWTGQTITPSWALVNGSAGGDLGGGANAGNYATTGRYYSDAGLAGAKTLDPTAETDWEWTMGAVEITTISGSLNHTVAPTDVMGLSDADREINHTKVQTLVNRPEGMVATITAAGDVSLA